MRKCHTTAKRMEAALANVRSGTDLTRAVSHFVADETSATTQDILVYMDGACNAAIDDLAGGVGHVSEVVHRIAKESRQDPDECRDKHIAVFETMRARISEAWQTQADDYVGVLAHSLKEARTEDDAARVLVASITIMEGALKDIVGATGPRGVITAEDWSRAGPGEIVHDCIASVVSAALVAKAHVAKDARNLVRSFLRTKTKALALKHDVVREVKKMMQTSRGYFSALRDKIVATDFAQFIITRYLYYKRMRELAREIRGPYRNPIKAYKPSRRSSPKIESDDADYGYGTEEDEELTIQRQDLPRREVRPAGLEDLMPRLDVDENDDDMPELERAAPMPSQSEVAEALAARRLRPVDPSPPHEGEWVPDEPLERAVPMPSQREVAEAMAPRRSSTADEDEWLPDDMPDLERAAPMPASWAGGGTTVGNPANATRALGVVVAASAVSLAMAFLAPT